MEVIRKAIILSYHMRQEQGQSRREDKTTTSDSTAPGRYNVVTRFNATHMPQQPLGNPLEALKGMGNLLKAMTVMEVLKALPRPTSDCMFRAFMRQTTHSPRRHKMDDAPR